jgi:hypothetical protein
MSRSNGPRRKPPSTRKRDSLALNRVLNRNRQLSATEKLEVILPARMAFEALRQMQYGEDDVFSLYCAVKISLIFVQTNAPELIDPCKVARNCLAEIYQHWHEHKVPRVITEHEQASILMSVEVYESIVDRATPDELVQLLTTTYQQKSDTC